jgi:hypothetical protein
MGRLSLKRLNAEGLEGEPLYWGPDVIKERLWRQGFLVMGVQFGNLE